MALKGLCRHEDALISLLHCAATERTLLNDIRDEIAKVFYSQLIILQIYYITVGRVGVVCCDVNGRQTSVQHGTSEQCQIDNRYKL